jgi:transcription initiation factor TFIID subunit 7
MSDTSTSGIRIKLKTNHLDTIQESTPRIRIKPINKDNSDGLPPELENLTRFEDYFLLRLPRGDALDRLRQEVRERSISDQVSIKFTGKLFI